jgi:pimeloyl-ACP methyl ester carboxylesterase
MRHKNFIQNSLRQLFGFILITSVFGGALPIAAQRRATTKSTKTTLTKNAATQNQSAAKCNGGWSGIVTFQKTLKESSDRTGKNIGGGTTRHVASRDYNYAGRIFVNGSDARAIQTRAQFSLSDKDDKFKRFVKKDTCFYDGKGMRDQWGETVEKLVTSGFAEGEGNFWMNVNQQSGTYSFNFSFPEGKGTETRESKTTAGGWCNAKFNEPSERTTNSPMRVDREGAEISDQKIDPENPEVLSGSKTWDTSSATIKSFVYEVSWYFTRCPAQLLITDLKFEHPDFPNYDDWQEIQETKGTIDGNRVRVKVKVLNMSGETKYATVKLKETYKGDKWNSIRPDESLPESETSLRLETGEEREVEYVWNTDGQSWFDDGRAHLLHRIKAELEENGQKKDEKTEQLKIAPRPLVLVHGFWDSPGIWSPYQNYMTTLHSYDWQAFPVGEKAEQGQLQMGRRFGTASTYTMTQNALELDKYVKYAHEERNAWHVDIVAHSSGGLVARRYIHSLMPESPDNRPVVSRLLMLGTPNAGTACADIFSSAIGIFGSKVEALRELQVSEVSKFNNLVKNRRGVKFSALAGNSVPATCGQQKITPGTTGIDLEWGDGVVSVDSAKAGVKDSVETKGSSEDLLGAAHFSDFVRPRVAIGPKGDHSPEASQSLNQIKQNPNHNLPSMFTNASFKNGEVSASENLSDDNSAVKFAKEVKMAANQSIEIEIPIEAASYFGLVFVAASEVSATLFDSRGAIVGKNLNGSAESKSAFRSIFVNRAVSGEKLKLKLENTGASETSIIVAAWTNTAQNQISFTLEADKASAG